MEGTMIVTIILNIIIIFISLYLIFLYIKSKTFHIFPCYNLMIFSFTILFDNIIRLIPTSKAAAGFQYIQAFLLTFLDKLVLPFKFIKSFLALINNYHFPGNYNLFRCMPNKIIF